MPSSLSSAEESDMETGLFVQSDVEYSVNKGPPMHPPRDQGPYPVRGTMTETNNPSATHTSVFGSLIKQTLFLLTRKYFYLSCYYYYRSSAND